MAKKRKKKKTYPQDKLALQDYEKANGKLRKKERACLWLLQWNWGESGPVADGPNDRTLLYFTVLYFRECAQRAIASGKLTAATKKVLASLPECFRGAKVKA